MSQAILNLSPAPVGDVAKAPSAGTGLDAPALLTLPGRVIGRDGTETARRSATPERRDCSFVLYIVCAWCLRPMGTKESFVEKHAGDVTHGLCPACFERQTGIPWERRNAA